MDPLSPLPAGKRLEAHPSLLCPRKAAAQCTHSGWSPLWCRAKSCDQAICPLHVPVPASEQQFNDPPPPSEPFVLGEANTLFQMYFSRGSNLCYPDDPLTAAHCGTLSSSLSHSFLLSLTSLCDNGSFPSIALWFLSPPSSGLQTSHLPHSLFPLCRLFS